MAAHVVILTISWAFLVQTVLVLAVEPHKRFEYKLSFKGPHLVQQDGSIPFWEHTGHAIASDESIRITPSLRSKKGQVWSKTKSTSENFELEVTFRVSGRGRIGADGLAIWYTKERGSEGPVFGSSDKWDGLALIFDSFDNDNQHNNPYILAMVNDGTKQYDHNTDGSMQQIGGCLRDFRNKPFPVRAKIEYYKKALTVSINNGMSNNKDDYELCLRAGNIELPADGYFGITAATGGLADDHDVHSFLTHSLHPPADTPTKGGQQVTDDEKDKFNKEFDDYYQKLQKAKEDYKKEHPDKKPGEFDDYDNDDSWFESMDERQLKLIFDGQNGIHTTIRELHKKLDEVVGRQERTMSQISLMSQGTGQGGQVQGQQQGQQQGGGQQYQVLHLSAVQTQIDSFNANNRDVLNYIREFSTILNDIKRKDAATGSNGQYAGEQLNVELKNTMNSLQQDMRALIAKPTNTQPCPDASSSCVTPFYMFCFLALQITVFIMYQIYKNNKENSAKKFY